jgi:DNA-binding MarR family transcriptional regulator
VLSAAASGDRTVAQLAQRLGVARQAVQRLADLLTEDGLAIYVDNPNNLRSPLLRLTHPGKDLLDALTKTADTYHQELAEGLSVKEIEIALVVVRKLYSQIDRDLNAEGADSK